MRPVRERKARRGREGGVMQRYYGTKKAQEDVSPVMAPVNQIPVRFLRVYPKPRRNTGKAPTVPVSHLSERLSAVNSDPEKLKGRDDTDFHAQQKALLGASLI
jgi:hypothetical protein